MLSEFFHRIRKDLLITLEGLREAVLAVAERVTRKVQILSLHRTIAEISTQMQLIQQEVGHQVAATLLQEPPPRGLFASEATVALEQRLADGARRIQVLRQDLERVDGFISELEMETLREELLVFQRDLAIRSASLERFTLLRGAVAIGRSVRDLNLPPAVRLVAVFRGAMLLLSFEHLRFRAGDTVLLLGHRTDIKEAIPRLLTRRSATA